MKSRCKHGHQYTPENTRWYVNKKGRRYYQCRKCHAIVEKIRYCLNDEYRLKEIARVSAYYRKKRDEKRGSAPADLWTQRRCPQTGRFLAMGVVVNDCKDNACNCITDRL